MKCETCGKEFPRFIKQCPHCELEGPTSDEGFLPVDTSGKLGKVIETEIAPTSTDVSRVPSKKKLQGASKESQRSSLPIITGMRIAAVMLLGIASLLIVAWAGYFVVSEFLNQPRWTSSGELHDILGRNVYPAPKIVQTIFPFLTDTVTSGPPATQTAKDVMEPWSGGKYWLGWKWSLIDWVSLIFLFGVMALSWIAGSALWKARTPREAWGKIKDKR